MKKITTCIVTLFFAFNSYCQTTNIFEKDGNVGIGIENPTAKLGIKAPAKSGSETLMRFEVGNAANDYLLINNATGANGQYIPAIHGHHASDNRQAMYITGSISQATDTGTEPITIFDARISNSSVINRPLFAWDSYGQRKMILSANGSLGIGTSDPKAKLHIEGNGYIANKITGTTAADLHLEVTGNDKLILRKDNHSTRFFLLDNLGKVKQDNILVLRNHGSVGIGTSTTGTHKLAVDGTIGAREIKVEATGWSDFVFENDYKLKDLEEVESFIKENKHLPDVPSEKEVLENGIQLGEMDAKLLQKIEELTLYVIEQDKTIKEMQAIIERNNLK